MKNNFDNYKKYLNPLLSNSILIGFILITIVLAYVTSKASAIGDEWSRNSRISEYLK